MCIARNLPLTVCIRQKMTREIGNRPARRRACVFACLRATCDGGLSDDGSCTPLVFASFSQPLRTTLTFIRRHSPWGKTAFINFLARGTPLFGQSASNGLFTPDGGCSDVRTMTTNQWLVWIAPSSSGFGVSARSRNQRPLYTHQVDARIGVRSPVSRSSSKADHCPDMS